MNFVGDWLGQKIPEFGQLPDKDKTAIFDFSILWSFFEGTKLNGKANVPSIRSFVENQSEQEGINTIDLTCYIDYLRNRYLVENEYSEKYYSLHLEKSSNPIEVDQMLKEENTSKKDCLIGCLVVVYRLRNNLFHGDKWKYNLQDQYSNFSNASKLLINLLN